MSDETPDSQTPEPSPAEADPAAAEPAAADPQTQTAEVELPTFKGVLAESAGGDLLADSANGGIEMLADVDLDVRIELGRTHMLVEDVLRLAEGSVVELDKLAGDPVDVYVNQRLVARGEVLVLNDNFCVRVNEIVGDSEELAEDAADAAPVTDSEFDGADDASSD
jgi:flagellar motor switch protein FliN/FliY